MNQEKQCRADLPVRLMLSCDNCRKKKIRCNGDKPVCNSCQKSNTLCHYSPVGPRKKPRRPRMGSQESKATKRRASEVVSESEPCEAVDSVSQMMLKESKLLEPMDQPLRSQTPPVMEMLRLQSQISGLVDQLRTLTIRVSEASLPVSPASDSNCAARSPSKSTNVSPKPPRRGPSTQPSQCNGFDSKLDVSRDLIKHLISVYFEYGHPSETGMYPMELYRDQLERAQVSETFLLSTLAVASRFSDDPRVQREPAYLAGYEFFERVTRSRMMDVLERDTVENMLTLNNLAVFAVGLPVANRSWYFSGLALRMATQMSLQKVDAPGRMPGASMMSGAGIESARRAFWTTLLLEALASFCSGEPPPITIPDIHVAEPFDDPAILDNDTERQKRPNVSAYIAQLSKFLIRVARLNGNRHPESAQFSPEYAALHAEMVAWYHALPDSMQVRTSTAKEEISRDPRQFAAKMFVHCHYHAAIIALHQPRADLVRVESSYDKEESQKASQEPKQRARTESTRGEWRQLAQQQCLTAACTITELLALARTLDVRYHIVTFGFAVFMAGVVHVGAVACTPRNSNERQYSVNCVREHVGCLDRLGKYFAFHFIMAKHIRAQLQTIEVTDVRRSALAMVSQQSLSSVQLAQSQQWNLDNSAASMSFPQLQRQQLRTSAQGTEPALGLASLEAAASLLTSSTNSPKADTNMSSTEWLFSGTSSLSNSNLAAAQPSSLDAFLNMLSQDSSSAAQCPGVSVCAGLCGAHSPQTVSRMAATGLSGMAGMAGMSSLVELFSPSTMDNGSSVYPQQMLSNSSLAPDMPDSH
ncbi:hypothetical protein LPJ55_000832 [Coemansia sp. RSA 990]|nr:hypothetical protein BX667DRAFT_495766 [Coemansia mojavensis]KAJ1739728.1 hypothetical protein LPJ68_004416 [Coemansia sp. RSA 1086]KAJ1753464.1 hypothetical protein LPJ79_000323 [Coemansia sp. RSA 1821]KAJ1875303.1 hypothetical protein LPJ55_000832 [Coemansia sp. RSA 990]KAJ2676617.1 hypothetical protein IWW42_000492 [Coemansia sp. RSA 1085]